MAGLVSYRFSEKTLSQNIKVERDQGKTPSLGLAAHPYIYTNKYNTPPHTHTLNKAKKSISPLE